MAIRKVLSLALAVTALSAVAATAAFGEGNFLSSIDAALTGFQSRTWTDNNSDNAATIIRFRGCTTNGGNGASTSVNLRRVISAWPDDSKGNKTLHCATVDQGNWGDVQAGNYRFRIDKINGAESGLQLWVDSLRVLY